MEEPKKLVRRAGVNIVSRDLGVLETTPQIQTESKIDRDKILGQAASGNVPVGAWQVPGVLCECRLVSLTYGMWAVGCHIGALRAS